MGMDVYGKKPTTEAGQYFRNNCWWWRPLAQYACSVAPEITAKCKYWQSNDGDGLGDEDSKRLADVLQDEIDSGRCEAYALNYDLTLRAEPDQTCSLCNGSGVRTDVVGVEMKMPERVVSVDAGHHRAGQTGYCNGCNGKGSRRPDSNSYPFSVENVQEFIEFLRGCGGFEIW